MSRTAWLSCSKASG